MVEEIDSPPFQQERVKSRRKQKLDDSILLKYYQSKKLKSLVGKDENEQVPDEESQNSSKSLPEVTQQEKSEADIVLDEVDKISKAEKKRNAKEKKKYKLKLKKLAKKAEADAMKTKESKQEKAVEYLKQWKKKPDEWKFRKNYHVWLLNNWKHSSRISDKHFKRFLKYLKSVDTSSAAFIRLKKVAKDIIENPNLEEGNNGFDRARQILQWID